MPVLWQDSVITREIIRNYTARVIVHRILRENARKTRMALELKGLKSTMRSLQGRVDRLNSIATKADEKGAMLEDHLSDVHSQLANHVDDIEFAANILGNSGGGSDESGKAKEPVKPPPAVLTPEQPKNESTAVRDSLEVGSASASNFHEL